MNLRFWKKPAPGWTHRLSQDEKRTLADNLRSILDPKRVIEQNRLKNRLKGQTAPLR
ncbi:MAG: hypothetical protein ACYS0F_19905 [Planctomycetota bacterium]|jgi:hypothetical protein